MTTNTSPSLEQAVLSFAQWRNAKGDKRVAVPEALARQAVVLLGHYSRSKIVQSLNISGSMLSRWIKRYQQEAPIDFIALPKATEDKPAFSCLCRFPNGIELQLSGIPNVTWLETLSRMEVGSR